MKSKQDTGVHRVTDRTFIICFSQYLNGWETYVHYSGKCHSKVENKFEKPRNESRICWVTQVSTSLCLISCMTLLGYKATFLCETNM